MISFFLLGMINMKPDKFNKRKLVHGIYFGGSHPLKSCGSDCVPQSKQNFLLLGSNICLFVPLQLLMIKSLLAIGFCISLVFDKWSLQR